MKNILFINYGGIGDEILFLPSIASVKKEFPNSKITIALEPRSKAIAELTDLIDETMLVDIKARGAKKYFNILKLITSCWFKKFDLVISSGKSPFVALILFLMGIKERIGYNSKLDFLLTKKVTLDENKYAAKMYHDLVEPIVNIEYQNPKININGDFRLELGLKNYIIIHPGVSKMSISKEIYKCPKSAFWINLISNLLKKGQQVVLLGTDDDKDLIEEILKDRNISQHPNFKNYYKKTKNIMEMAFLMKNSKCVICVDSAPLHVAVGVEAKVFAIFGPTNENKLVPNSDKINIIKNNIPCRPCLWHVRSRNCEKSDCLNIDFNKILNKID